MSSNPLLNNRNSTPEPSSASLRPPSSRTIGTGHQLRASADMSTFSPSPLSGRSLRPASEMLYNQSTSASNYDAMDKAAEQWLADIEQCENTLEEMATATTDQDFKAELTAIEEWFRVLSEAERTASLYALLQQATKVQILFFIQTLEEMLRKHPMPGILASSKLGDQDSSQKADQSRNSVNRPLASPAAKRNSTFDPSAIVAMFPDAANAIAKKKAEYSQQTGNAPPSNRNSLAFADRNSLVAPSIAEPKDSHKENMAQPSPTPWGRSSADSRPKSSAGQQPMGQFSQPSSAAGNRAPRPLQLAGGSNLQSTSVNAPDGLGGNLPVLSPYNVGSWASMSNTPMQPNFNTDQNAAQADMVANAAAMKLAALSTVNNRVLLDDARKYRRARSNDGEIGGNQMPASPGFPQQVVVVNESGQLVNSRSLNPQQLAAIQAQQQAAFANQRGRPESPALTVPGTNYGNLGFSSPQNSAYLSAYDATGSINPTLAALTLNQLGLPQGVGGHEGYMSDHSDIARGRSPRGRRGTSKPPEDPTDLTLLQDIPGWLRSLRLHKYTDNLKDIKWQDLIELDHKGLEERGVNALGARNKMLKVFEQVKEAKAEGKI